MTMNYAYTPYIWPSVFTVILLIALSIYSGRRRSVPGAAAFSIACLFGAAWAAGSVMEYAAVDLATKIAWVKFQSACSLPVIIAITCFILEYAWPGRWLTRRVLALLAFTWLLEIVLILTNELHHLVWRGFGFDESVLPRFGPGGWLVIAYGIGVLGILNLIVLGWLFLRGTMSCGRVRIDYRGAAIFIGAIFSIMLGFNSIAEYSTTFARGVAVVLIVTGVGLIWYFLRYEKRSANPILDMELLKSRPFLAANLFNLLLGATTFGVFSFTPLYAISVYGLSTLGSGMILTPRSLGGIAAAGVTSFFLTRWGYRKPMMWGLIIGSVTTVVLGQGLPPWNVVDWVGGKVAFLGSLMLIAGIGVGMIMPPSNNACIELMPEKVATITGLRGMFRTVGGVLGISLITMILHLSSNPVTGFRIAFTSFGLGMLIGLPLILMTPDGREGR